MNIFASYECPVLSAVVLDDSRVVKMILETAQMLNTVAITKYDRDLYGYKVTHKNHPCTVWVAQSTKNFDWLVKHGLALCNEYTARYGRRHKCENYIIIAQKFNKTVKQDEAMTPFVNCTSEHKDIKDVHLAYRECLKAKYANSKRTPTWFKRSL